MAPVVQKRKREGIQLCKVFNPEKPPKFKSVVFEPKKDGYRCIARIENGKAELLTSTGLPHWNVEHIKNQLEDAAKKHCSLRNIVLDGELMHRTLPFDVAGGILRDHKPHPEAAGIYLVAWDTLTTGEFDEKTCERTLEERKFELNAAVSLISAFGKSVVAIEYYFGIIDAAEKYARQFRGKGDEGVIIKDADGLYEFKKSSTWLKWKPDFGDDGVAVDRKDGDFTIVDAIEGRGKHEGRLGALKIIGMLLDDGNIQECPASTKHTAKDVKVIESEVGTGFTDAQRNLFWKMHKKGQLVGKVVEVKYQELSKDGALRFPAFFRMREDKD